MDNKIIIDYFYTAFANGDAERMVSCYHDDIEFSDPAFGTLKTERAKNMWRMLLQKNKSIQISHDNVHANNQTGSANWQAQYVFTPTGRKVVNNITAKFEFKDGKIIRHIDHFNMWKWSRQALGLKGLLLGWSAFMKNKIRDQANRSLDNFIKHQHADS
jgi:ketosteroid isomerase-like protein